MPDWYSIAALAFAHLTQHCQALTRHLCPLISSFISVLAPASFLHENCAKRATNLNRRQALKPTEGLTGQSSQPQPRHKCLSRAPPTRPASVNSSWQGAQITSIDRHDAKAG